jgi:peptidoglycan/LPS O-acetylase OafA/YrhL
MRMDTLAAGAYLAVRVREPGGLAQIQSLARRLGAVSALTILGIILYQRGYGHTPLVTTLGFSCNAALAFSVIALALSSEENPMVSRVFSLGALRFFGKYSYCLYMIHMLVEETLSKYVNADRLVPEVWG